MRGRILLLLALLAPADAYAQKKKGPVVTAPPIRLEIPQPTETYGSWTVSKWSEGAYAASIINESRSGFGVICASGCYAYFNPVIACADGHQYPALVNSSSGSFSVILTCIRTKDEQYAIMTMPFNRTIYDSMEIGGTIGIAFPMESGEFKVSRFSLTGALKATERAFSLSPAARTDATPDGLKDQTL